MARLLQIRRGTAAEWTSENPTLAIGEPGFETDTGFLKIGDGSTAWTSLSYAAGGTTLAILTGLTPAANTFPYFTGAGTGALANISSYIRSLLNLADEPALKSAINLEIGTDVQAYAAPQDTATWEAGVGTDESGVSPAKIAAAIAALEAPQSGVPDAKLEDQKAAGNHGGTATSGSWFTRELNTEYDPGGVMTLATNQFTPASNGWVKWLCPGHRVNEFQSRLYNVSDSVAAAIGTSCRGAGGESLQVYSTGEGPVAAGKTYQVEMRVSNTQANDGRGIAANFGTELYTQVVYWKAHQT